MSSERSSFTGKIGFVLAAAGSAVGLGNIWRFPYLAAKYGGGIFLLVYIVLAITFGFTLMITEIAIGRKTKLSAIGAYRSLNKKFSFIGYLAAIVPIIILPYYSVIGGWVIKYLAGFVSGRGDAMASGMTYFGGFIGTTVEPILWFLLFLGLTAVVVLLGVEKGVEKVSKIMMPALIALILFIAIYAIVTIDGAWEGVKYYFMPDFSKFSIMTVVAAMGQLFYSMSLAMGIMITYGSYMKKDISIEKSAKQIEIFDTGIAILAGLLIVPAVYAFSGGDEAALGAGPGLMFGTLPQIFDVMPFGDVIGAVFFIMVFFAAITSSISLMETVVSIIQDRFHTSRRMTCLIVIGICLLLGIPSSLGFGLWSNFTILGLSILDFFDFISNNVIMPLVALATCIFVAFVLKPKSIEDELEIGGKAKKRYLFNIVVKFIAPICLIVILVSSVLNVFGVISI
ncbi:MAG: sodium-dependent transporter [Clostridia bacterium]|nr:sodium-dependent transporter [Clostridia bacterium]